MKNIKRIVAAAGVALLAGIYLCTLVFALLDSPWAFQCLKISIGFTILIPVLLWIYLSMFRYMENRRKENQSASSQTEE